MLGGIRKELKRLMRSICRAHTEEYPKNDILHRDLGCCRAASWRLAYENHGI